MNDSALKRISYRAGVYRTGRTVLLQLRKLGEKYLYSVINYAIIYAEYAKRVTISEEDIIHALEKGYISLYPTGGPGKIKQCKISNKKKIISRIREYQRQSNCFTLAKAPIEALIRQECDSIYSDNNPSFDVTASPFRWSSDALRTLHFALEYMLYKLCFAANKIAIHAKRSTIQMKDINLAIELINDNCQNSVIE
jgi:histone H3/H4